jgi:hypothetical protein
MHNLLGMSAQNPNILAVTQCSLQPDGPSEVLKGLDEG